MTSQFFIQSIEIGTDKMVFNIDEQFVEVPYKLVSKKLAEATLVEKKYYKISPAGYGVHWPLIDEDLSLNGILKTLNIKL
jgi:Protein of unknown function (DUF2442)